MRTLFTLFSLVLLFGGCNIKHPPKDVDLDTLFDTVPAFDANNPVPYDSTFQTLLDKSSYLAPDGNTSDSLHDFSSENFYLDDENKLTFALNKTPASPRTASMLLQKQTWQTKDSEGNFYLSQVRCYKPKKIDAYTWMEVHGLKKLDDNQSIYYNYPLVKLVWKRNFNNLYDHIWAIMTKSTPSESEPKIYEYIDLGPRPDYIFPAEVHIRDNILEVKINYSTMTTQNVSYWEDVPSYFKVGISIEDYNDEGVAATAFSELNFEDNASNVSDITHF
ncbi:polysaccharide lyase family 7 protein [Sulfurimonas sp.]|uniref:polysaccharide lyase family 7 protein n=1 Tax=Sulfurimonas sp. TaxID=2022749 RepID=UPI002604D721|nr:polysaccharide lyase family 7 protein [Sulfurimonas sp.]